MTRAVLFDLDDTLVVEEAMAIETFQVVCSLAQDRSGVDAAALHQAVRRCAKELWYSAPTGEYCRTIGISSWEGLWGRFTSHAALGAWAPSYQFESWKRGLSELGIDRDSLAVELCEAFRTERRKRHRSFPDTEPVLRELHGRYALGLITNGASDLQREKVQGAGLGSYFDLVLASGDIGVGKPDRRIFDFALNTLKVAPEQALMIGDSVHRDVAGAHGAGIRGVWLNRYDRPPDGGSEPETVVRGLRDLIGLV